MKKHVPTPKTPLPAKTVDAVLKAVLVFSRTVEQVLQTRAVETGVDLPLSSSKAQILRLLGQRGGQTATQVARFLGVSKPAVTQIIDSMVRARLVTRRTAKSDRREVNLALSKRGRDLFRLVRRRQRHYVRSALRSSRNGDAEDWVETLHDISGALARADEAFKHFCAQCGAHQDGSCVLVGGDADCPFLRHTAKSRRT